MPDTITALDTATTDELIAALMARHRAVLWQVCGPLEREDYVRKVVDGAGDVLADRLGAALVETTRGFLAEHPAVAPPPPFPFPPLGAMLPPWMTAPPMPPMLGTLAMLETPSPEPAPGKRKKGKKRRG